MSPSSEMPVNRESLFYLEAVYQQYQSDPQSVDPQWRAYFASFDGGMPVVSAPVPAPPAAPAATPPPGPAMGGVGLENLPILKSAHVFKDVPEAHLALLAGIASELNLPTGHYLCRMGESGSGLYFIKEGSVIIKRGGRQITHLGAGEVVGELAVLDERPRSADVVTETPVSLLCIEREQLNQLLNNQPHLALALLRVMAARLRDAGFRQERVDQLVRAYRERGHVLAKLDPLGRRQADHPELDLAHYGFKESDLDVKFTVNIGRETAGRSLRDIHQTLSRVYCQAIGAQFMHIDDLEIQEWLRVRLEEYNGDANFQREEQIRILKKLTDAEVFENFLHRQFVGAKRFSLEGAESLIPLLELAVEEAGNHGIDEIIIGMAHRGRLNVLVNIMEKPASQVFREFRDVDPNLHKGGGDVKYHLGYSCNRLTSSGRNVHISLCFNPSHLEFVAPVVLGRARAKQDHFKDFGRERAMPLVIHGDAAFAGQGVVQELLNLSELPGYSIGGTVHVVINNQIGFTTNPEEARSCQYSTDVARMLQIPIFHVNGEHPEAVAEVIRLAMDFRKKFKKDVVIDMYCYRKYGHNEGDDPAFTQPLMYAAIKKRKTVRAAYVDNLLKLGGIRREEADEIATQSKRRLELDLEEARRPDFELHAIRSRRGQWSKYSGGPDASVPDAGTGYPLARCRYLLMQLTALPEGFSAHSKIKRFLERQQAMAQGTQPLNWGAGEALAFATLLAEGHHVRITGQDAERGTFSHRHAVLHDTKTDARYAPLANINPEREAFQIFNSPLSETAVLGFEYGYCLDAPGKLVVWEAQFGDFCNVAQVIIDQFISSSEDKWRRLNGLCMFLPHGFEGQGPEHSSARLERFLMLAAEDNMQVVNLTTPAQLFHCLRRQVLRPWRKPLIVMSPKSLLRHPRAVSSLEDMAEGNFQKVIPDQSDAAPNQVQRVLICSGKLYYELEAFREEKNAGDVAILRLEQYYPLPLAELEKALSVYPPNTPVSWVQEEPHNMGAWPFLKLNLGQTIPGNGTHPFNGISRPPSASPATGSAASHKIEQETLIKEAFAMEMELHLDES